MANRVTGSEVKEVINTILTSAQVEPFILGANAVVTAKCSAYSTAEQKELERWLSAHFVSIRDPSRSAVVSQKAGEAEQAYQLTSKNPVGLATTPYGQQVLMLDYNRVLVDLGKTATRVVMAGYGADNEDFD